ncbi:rhomboid family intramembrane serine protease [Alcanivorax sp.]|uniref:rhomboid family intramembrane serine protease n=1 Tax=Alcanivorax sp. TaxID=1872427 RepID=UPI000C0D38DD|nr:rhomboid family intramembrane serine protease [Alcanivorax sp.]PHR65448.1 MAG: rhomboid family intramembrane serine protease [Alcanivorax sp.]
MTKPTTAQTATDQAAPAWRNAPWVMAVLAITLLAGQFFNNGNAVQPVLGWYQNGGLKTLEWDNYLSWLRFNNQSDLSQRLEQNAGMDAHVYGAALFADDFVTDSKRRARDFWSSAEIEQWNRLREQIPAQVAASNLYRWGLPDSSPRPARFFTAPFTGGSLWLSLATLLLLAPLAPTLERRLGHGRVFALWILGCLLSGFGYLLLASPGQIPFHGATAPLLVWFGAFFGLQRSTLQLPLWHPKHRQWQRLPVSPYTLLPLPVAVMAALALFSTPLLANLSAGIAAFIGGLLLVQIMRPQPVEAAQQDNPPTDPQQLSSLTRGWDALGQLNGDVASTAFAQILATEPDHFDALTGQFTAQQLLSDNAAWTTVAQQLFVHPATEEGQAIQVAQCWQQYRQRGGNALPAAIGWPLLQTLTRAGEFQKAEKLARELDDHALKADAIAQLRDTLLQEGLAHRAKALA